jgi:hypothetical protein
MKISNKKTQGLKLKKQKKKNKHVLSLEEREKKETTANNKLPIIRYHVPHQ